jgi:hypothetical protein
VSPSLHRSCNQCPNNCCHIPSFSTGAGATQRPGPKARRDPCVFPFYAFVVLSSYLTRRERSGICFTSATTSGSSCGGGSSSSSSSSSSVNTSGDIIITIIIIIIISSSSSSSSTYFLSAGWKLYHELRIYSKCSKPIAITEGAQLVRRS